MSRSRLNDTAALTSRPMEAGMSHSVSARKIDNGFIVSESTCNPKTGEYRSTEHFSEKAPLAPQRMDRGSESSLRDAMDLLNDDR